MILFVISMAVVVFVLYLMIKPYFSPFKNIPSPPQLPIIGHTHHFWNAKDQLNLYKGWCDQFKNERMFYIKNMMTLGESVVLTNLEDAKKILSRPDIMVRGKFIKKYFPLLGNGLLTSKGKDHVFQKKLLGKAFSNSHLKHYVHSFSKHSATLCQILEVITGSKKDGKNIDIMAYLENAALDIIGEISFGCNFYAQTQNSNLFVQNLKNHLNTLTQMISRTLVETFPFLWYLPVGPAAKLQKSDMESRNIINKIFQERKRKVLGGHLTNHEEKDMLSLMMNVKDDETNECLSDQLIQDLSYTFLIASVDTTSTALTWALLMLAKDDNLQRKLRGEIIENVPCASDLTIENADKLLHMHSFIKEVLRLHGSAAFLNRVSQKEFTLHGITFPAGTSFLLPLFYYNLENFGYDSTFDDERFLSKDSSNTMLSFGYGPYSCIGKQFALMEMKIILINLIPKFKFSVDPEFQSYNCHSMAAVIKTDKPITIRFTKLVQ